jgi:peptidoglycan hydrolase-like protein with peptidoglycan-binding domain
VNISTNSNVSSIPNIDTSGQTQPFSTQYLDDQSRQTLFTAQLQYAAAHPPVPAPVVVMALPDSATNSCSLCGSIVVPPSAIIPLPGFDPSTIFTSPITPVVSTPTPAPSSQPATYHDPTPETGTGWPQLTISTQGEAVKSLQYLLQQSGATLSVSGVDGKFGQETLQAVTAFQKAQGITADGVVGQKTWLALIVTVQQGSQGAAVRAVQSQLKSRGQAVTVDGNFGGQTDSAVRAYQQARGLTVDGQVGPQTWKALLTGT